MNKYANIEIFLVEYILYIIIFIYNFFKEKFFFV